MADPISCGLIVGGCIVLGGFVLYKVLPAAIDWVSAKLSDFFYKKVIVTLSQNKLKTINLVKYLHQISGSNSHIRTASIAIDNIEYNVPLNQVYVKYEGYDFGLKANVDGNGNLVNIICSTYKRRWLFWLNRRRLESFDRFMAQFPSAPPAQSAPDQSAPAMLPGEGTASSSPLLVEDSSGQDIPLKEKKNK